MNYYISDLHFGHKNCLSFDNRPFLSIEENDETLISNWNNTVGVTDDVYILGDISWYNATKTIEIYHNLNGIKHLIIGNHDYGLIKNKDLQKEFVEITEYKKLELDNETTIILSHYPIPCFDKHYYGAYHLYGHVHNSFEWNMIENFKKQIVELYDKQCNMYNVGCMMSYMNYTPRTLREIIERNN